jgi:hypothetical protein
MVACSSRDNGMERGQRYPVLQPDKWKRPTRWHNTLEVTELLCHQRRSIDEDKGAEFREHTGQMSPRVLVEE